MPSSEHKRTPIPLPEQATALNFWSRPRHVEVDAVPLLWEGTASLTLTGGRHVQVPGRVVWEDRPEFHWEDPRIILPSASAVATFGMLKCRELLVTVTAFMPPSTGRAVLIDLKMPTVPVHSVEFHLVNAKNLGGGRYAVGEFFVSLVQTLVPQDHQTIFTHLGRIERQDGTTFVPESEAYELLVRALTWTLTFISAGLVTPVLERGFDQAGTLIWADYSPHRLTNRPARNDNWIHQLSPTVQASVQEVLAGFHDLITDPVWADALGLAVDFYANASEPALVSGARLILLQAGLEKLVSTWDAGTEASALPAAVNQGIGARLARMLDWAGIGTAVPLQLPELFQLISSAPVILNMPGANAPQVMAYVRNKLTHVRPASSPLIPKHETQATRLASRYLELLLLRLAGATSGVVNPLITNVREGTVEPLPWV